MYSTNYFGQSRIWILKRFKNPPETKEKKIVRNKNTSGVTHISASEVGLWQAIRRPVHVGVDEGTHVRHLVHPVRHCDGGGAVLLVLLQRRMRRVRGRRHLTQRPRGELRRRVSVAVRGLRGRGRGRG